MQREIIYLSIWNRNFHSLLCSIFRDLKDFMDNSLGNKVSHTSYSSYRKTQSRTRTNTDEVIYSQFLTTAHIMKCQTQPWYQVTISHDLYGPWRGCIPFQLTYFRWNEEWSSAGITGTLNRIPFLNNKGEVFMVWMVILKLPYNILFNGE